MQKFHRGNLVKVSEDATGYLSRHLDESRTVIIEYSDAERGCGSGTQYSVIFPTGGSVAWESERLFTLVEEGGEHLIKQAEEYRKKVEEHHRDINYILPKLEEGNLSATSILYLFELLGHDCRNFFKEGSYFWLMDDWITLKPLFMLIKKFDDVNAIERVAKLAFSENHVSKWNIERVWRAFHPDKIN